MLLGKIVQLLNFTNLLVESNNRGLPLTWPSLDPGLWGQSLEGRWPSETTGGSGGYGEPECPSQLDTRSLHNSPANKTDKMCDYISWYKTTVEGLKHKLYFIFGPKSDTVGWFWMWGWSMYMHICQNQQLSSIFLEPNRMQLLSKSASKSFLSKLYFPRAKIIRFINLKEPGCIDVSIQADEFTLNIQQ